jgi:hypothetical protein
MCVCVRIPSHLKVQHECSIAFYPKLLTVNCQIYLYWLNKSFSESSVSCSQKEATYDQVPISGLHPTLPALISFVRPHLVALWTPLLYNVTYRTW